MYPPCPVSMQVALPAQGLDEHRRVSVVKQERKTFSKRVLVAMCSPASSFHVSVPIFSPCLRFHTLAHVHTTASCHQEQNCELGMHRKAARLEEGCGASLHVEVNTKSTNRFCLMGHNSLFFKKKKNWCRSM